jgi:hypothetical protein
MQKGSKKYFQIYHEIYAQRTDEDQKKNNLKFVCYNKWKIN